MALKGFHLTKPLLLLSLLLSACSSEPAQQDESKSQSTQCSQEDISGGAAWITGQLNAFGSEDPKAAYNFASEQFRQGVSLDEFASIISGQYSALLSLKSFEIGRCFALEEGYVFQVDLIDNQNKSFTMQYVLSKIDEQWGVDAATIVENKVDPTL
ncbi:MAG: DUF4864 domain-containing protein [Actinobacteria bacterium]|nr:DUF4864 domain-containing protein [Actinomycetota bacterium]